jgi:NTP pyrophosphatase (non-canonical NTP hydrolase)
LNVLLPHSNAVILCEVADERAKQDAKHGDPFKKSLDRLMTIITEEVGEAATEVNDIVSGAKSATDDLRHELIQAAACCVQAIEVLDKTGGIL